MKTSNTIRIGLLALAAASLVACGGGGSSSDPASSNTGFDSTEFQGAWRRTDRTNAGDPANCFNFGDYGGTYGGLHRPKVLTATTVIHPIEVYSDTTCTNYLGLLERTYSISWSAAAVAGKTHVARVRGALTGFAIKPDGAPGFALTILPKLGEETKGLMDVEGTQLYIDDSNSPRDADGYPTVLESTALYTR